MNHTQRDELWDRLTDLSLREAVGGKRPQDNKSEVGDKSEIGDVVPASRVASAPGAGAGKGKRTASAERAGWMRPEDGPRRSALRVLVVATCLLVGLTLTIVINRAAGDRPWLWPVANNETPNVAFIDNSRSMEAANHLRSLTLSGHITHDSNLEQYRGQLPSSYGRYGERGSGRGNYADVDGDGQLDQLGGSAVGGGQRASVALQLNKPSVWVRPNSPPPGSRAPEWGRDGGRIDAPEPNVLDPKPKEVTTLRLGVDGKPSDKTPADGTSNAILNSEIDTKDFESVIQLIESTVKPESWKDAGGRVVDGTTVALALRAVTGKEASPEVIKEITERIRDGRGVGPGQGGDRYQPINENRFLGVGNNPLSTFSIDVDTASYSKVRRLLFQHHELPPPDAVRLEEFINYHVYNYAGPEAVGADSHRRPSASEAKSSPAPSAKGFASHKEAGAAKNHPFAVHGDVAACPWHAGHKLLRIAIKGREIKNEDRPPSNLVFLVDVSGSMDEPDRLPLVKKGLKNLVQRLRATDRVAIVVYAGDAGLVLPSTPGNEKVKIMSVLDELQPQGSTNGAQGIHLAYDIAAQNFIKGGTNRVILATDGDFNVGTTSDAELVRLVEKRAKERVFLTTLGVGIGNHNDAMLQQIADKGNGQCFYLDSELEADKVLVQQIGGTLVTIAKDVKIQVEFNPAKVAAYRLLGYEKRLLRTEDFKDDTKDAGEIGAGHTVTAFYEIVPVPHEPLEAPAQGAAEAEPTDLKYQKPAELTAAAATAELLTVHMRYKQPEADKSEPLDIAVNDADVAFGKAPSDFQFAAAVASFAMILRNSQYRGETSYDKVIELAAAGLKDDEAGYRSEFVDMVKRAKEIAEGGKPK